MARSMAAALFGCILLQVLLAVVIAIVTSTTLIGPNDACYLNMSGNVCTFAYATSGFSLFFSLLLLAGSIATLRATRTAPLPSFLPAECGSLAAFACFWWAVAAVTFTLRGGQASDAGLPAGAARGAVIALSWIECALFLLATLAAAYDRLLHARHHSLSAQAAQRLLDGQEAEERREQGEAVTDRSSSSSVGQLKDVKLETVMAVLNVTTSAHPAPPAPLATTV